MNELERSEGVEGGMRDGGGKETNRTMTKRG